jgi:hypothetical protein
MRETEYLLSIPGMRDPILKGMKEPMVHMSKQNPFIGTHHYGAQLRIQE